MSKPTATAAPGDDDQPAKWRREFSYGARPKNPDIELPSVVTFTTTDPHGTVSAGTSCIITPERSNAMDTNSTQNPPELAQAREHVRNAVRASIKSLDRMTETPDYQPDKVMHLATAIQNQLLGLYEIARAFDPKP